MGRPSLSARGRPPAVLHAGSVPIRGFGTPRRHAPAERGSSRHFASRETARGARHWGPRAALHGPLCARGCTWRSSRARLGLCCSPGTAMGPGAEDVPSCAVLHAFPRGCRGLEGWPQRIEQLVRPGVPLPPALSQRGPSSGSGAKVQEHGVAVFGQARVTTRHGTHVAGISQPSPSKHDNPKQQAGTHPRTQEHMALQPHQHGATLPAAGAKLQTKNQKKTQTCGKQGRRAWTMGGGEGGQRFEFSGVNYLVPYLVPSHCGLGRGRGTGEKQVIKKKPRH